MDWPPQVTGPKAVGGRGMEGRSDRGIGSRLSEPATYSVSPISRNPNPRHRDLMDFRPWLRAARQAILRPLLIQVRRGAVCAVGRAATNNLPRGALSLRVLKMQSTKSEERSTKNPGCFVLRSSYFHTEPDARKKKTPPVLRAAGPEYLCNLSGTCMASFCAVMVMLGCTLPVSASLH